MWQRSLIYTKKQGRAVIGYILFYGFYKDSPKNHMLCYQLYENRELLKDVPYVRIFHLSGLFRVVLNTGLSMAGNGFS